MSKVVPIGCITRLDTPPDQILEAAKGQMEGVVLLGYDKDGELYFASTWVDGGTVMWLLEQCKKKLMECVE
ncbi:MAG: hypothetical protein WC710_15155 [Gallionella sp.]|jgi:hypothetical protein